MNHFRIRVIVSRVAVAALFGEVSCTRSAAPPFDPMHAVAFCDTAAMKPFGRVVEIPDMHRRLSFGVLAGAVIQNETGDALEAAVVDLKALDGQADTARVWRYTNSKGGFSFDSLAPGAYAVRVRRIGNAAGAATIHPRTGRVDTLILRLRAERCVGY